MNPTAPGQGQRKIRRAVWITSVGQAGVALGSGLACMVPTSPCFCIDASNDSQSQGGSSELPVVPLWESAVTKTPSPGCAYGLPPQDLQRGVLACADEQGGAFLLSPWATDVLTRRTGQAGLGQASVQACWRLSLA